MDTSVGGILKPGTVQLTRKGKFHPCLLRCFSDDDFRLAWLTCECPKSNSSPPIPYVSLFLGRDQVNCRTAFRYRDISYRHLK